MVYAASSVGHTAQTGAIMSQPLNTLESSASNHLIGEKRDPEIIDTRFGKITITHDNPLIFEKGLLGMPERNLFKLLQFPTKKFSKFRLLQSLDDFSLSFICMPLELNNDMIAYQDLIEAAADLDIPETRLEIYLVVNVYREGSQVRMSGNARAPLFVDSERMRATQCVLRNNNYQVRQPLLGETISTLS